MFGFLVDYVYPNLCSYAEFQDLINERRGKKARVNNQSFQSSTTELP